MSNDTQQRPTGAPRSLLPRRSRGDRKLAGVAGGLGRSLGIDPVLIRIAFVVLAVFGGSGVLLYCLGWLLMLADGDEVSAIEALAGRGHSSVSTALTVVLIIVGLSSAGSVFSWGLPFWPVVIAAIVVFAIVRHGRAGSRRGSGPASADGNHWTRGDDGREAQRPGTGRTDWGRRADEWAEQVSAAASAWGERAGEWIDQRVHGWSAGSPTASSGADGAQRTGSVTEDEPSSTTGTTPDGPSPEDLLTGGRSTPPSWDPLGAAPFAWDLPDPGPAPTDAPTALPRARGRGVLGRVFLGLALITGGVLAGGVFAGWWALSWGAVAGAALAVVGVGLLLTSLRGAGGRALIGPGIFLSLVTLALTVTGITGTTGFGDQTWTPSAVADVQDSYHWNAGQATLDLSQLQIDKGQSVTTDLTVNGGQAVVLVPHGVTVEATCIANVGTVRCLGSTDDGMRPEATGEQIGDDAHGTLTLQVRSNAGRVEVRSGG